MEGWSDAEREVEVMDGWSKEQRDGWMEGQRDGVR